MDNHWIALYLSGQYPGRYIVPNKLDIIFKIRQIDSTNFGDPIIWLLQGKSDVEYFKTLLDTFKSLHSWKEFNSLLERIWVPIEAWIDPFKSEQAVSIKELSKYLDTVNETDFSRYVIMPILQAMGYKDIEYKWKVNETDFGNDFYPIKYISPSWLVYFTWVQTKSSKMSDGDTTVVWSELNKLISEAKTAFSQLRKINTWEEVAISEYLIFNSKTVSESSKDKFFQDKDLKDKPIKFFGKDWILSLVKELNMKEDFYK